MDPDCLKSFKTAWAFKQHKNSKHPGMSMSDIYSKYIIELLSLDLSDSAYPLFTHKSIENEKQISLNTQVKKLSKVCFAS